MKAEDLKTKSEDELKKMLLDLRKDQMNLRFQRTQGTLENTAQVRRSRRTIATIKTFLNQKTRQNAPAAAPKKAAAPKAKKTAAKKQGE